MAEKLKDIYQKLIEQKEASTELAGLNTIAGETMETFVSEISTSKVSIWRLWCFIVAFSVWTLQKLIDVFKLEVEYTAAKLKPHSVPWYRNRVLEFQNGKDLKWLNDVFYYEVIASDDLDALQIVKKCAVVESPGKLRVKISGATGPLTILEAERIAAYCEEFKDAGNKIVIVNNSGDALQLTIDAYVDPLVINTQDGTLVSDSNINPLEVAISDYLNNLDFNGSLSLTKLVDAMQETEGIIDPRLRIAKTKYGTQPFIDIVDNVIPDAGYFEINSLTINYLV